MNLVAISNLHLQLSCSTDTIPWAFPTSCFLLLESSIWYDLEMSKLRPERMHHLLTDIKAKCKKKKQKQTKKKPGWHPDNPIQDSIPSANILCWLSCPRSPLISFMGMISCCWQVFLTFVWEKSVMSSLGLSFTNRSHRWELLVKKVFSYWLFARRPVHPIIWWHAFVYAKFGEGTLFLLPTAWLKMCFSL